MKGMKMKRRDFIRNSGTALAAGAVSTLAAPAVLAQAPQTFNLKMVTTWPAGMLPMDGAVKRLAQNIEIATGGRIKIKVYSAGELVPPLEVFSAVSQGAADMGHATPFYWAGKIPSASWFSAVPFGMNREQIYTWLYAGDGMKLYEEAYAPHQIVPRPSGNTGVQAAGWFNKKIDSVKDFQGLKIRIAGLGGKVYAKLGASVVLIPGSEVFTSMEKGVIDAVEWTGPAMDERFNLHKVAKYCYYPGWHEPGTLLETLFNKKVYDSFGPELQKIVDMVCMAENTMYMVDNDFANSQAIVRLKAAGSEYLPFSDDVMAAARKAAAETMDEEAAKDPLALKVHKSYTAFKESMKGWSDLSEKQFFTRNM